MAISKKQGALSPESQAAVEAYERSEAKLKPLREAKTRDVGAQFLPEDEEFEIQEPAVAQAGPTVAQAAEEEAELESGQYKIPAMSKAAAKVAMQKRLSGDQEARLMRDLEDLPEPEAKAEVSREQTFRGAGNYTYAKTADGDWFFTSPSGKTGVAKKGSKAWQSITSESEGKGSLYGTEGFAGFEAKKSDEAGRSAGDNVPSYGADTRDQLDEILRGQGIDPATVDIYETGEEAGTKFFSVPKGTSEEDVLEVGKIRAEGAPQGAAEEEAEDPPAERLSASDVRGDFSLDNPPPVFSPKKMSLFLDQNPYIAQDPERLRAFINDANYSDRGAAAQAFVNTIRAKEEMASLAKKSENLSSVEARRLNELRLAFGKPRSLTDRTLSAALGAIAAPLQGRSSIEGAVSGFAGPSAQEAVAKSPGATQRGEAGEDFGALLEAEFASR